MFGSRQDGEYNEYNVKAFFFQTQNSCFLSMQDVISDMILNILKSTAAMIFPWQHSVHRSFEKP